MSQVDLSSLGHAILRLDEAVTAHRADPANLMIRDALIKRFEFTFELCQSSLRRFVEAYSIHLKATDRLTLPDLIRTASQDGLLLSGWDVWHGYREARNRTSHTYNESQAAAVAAIIPDFLLEAEHLYHQMLQKTP